MAQFKSLKEAMNFARTRINSYKTLINEARKNNDMIKVKKLHIALSSIKVRKISKSSEVLYELKGM